MQVKPHELKSMIMSMAMMIMMIVVMIQIAIKLKSETWGKWWRWLAPRSCLFCEEKPLVMNWSVLHCSQNGPCCSLWYLMMGGTASYQLKSVCIERVHFGAIHCGCWTKASITSRIRFNNFYNHTDRGLFLCDDCDFLCNDTAAWLVLIHLAVMISVLFHIAPLVFARNK